MLGTYVELIKIERRLESTYLYETPLYVVPTSNARTSFLRGPVYGERGCMLLKGESVTTRRQPSHFMLDESA